MPLRVVLRCRPLDGVPAGCPPHLAPASPTVGRRALPLGNVWQAARLGRAGAGPAASNAHCSVIRQGENEDSAEGVKVS